MERLSRDFLQRRKQWLKELPDSDYAPRMEHRNDLPRAIDSIYSIGIKLLGGLLTFTTLRRQWPNKARSSSTLS